MLDPITVTTLTALGMDVLKIWLPLGGVLFGVFRVITWIKNKFISIEKNVVDLKSSMDTNFIGLRNDVKDQTTSITTALAEQRNDFRTFYAPTLLMMQQHNAQFQANSPVRAKRAVRKPAKRK